MKSFLSSLGAWVALWSAAAIAHTHLLRTVPVENAVLESSPPVATLVFAEPVTLTALRIEGPGEAKTSVKPLPSDALAEASVRLPPLPQGGYKLAWRALSKDGHLMSGEIHFTIRAKAGP